MRGLRFVVLFVGIAAWCRSGLGAAPTLTPQEQDAGWAMLFNGADLSGWTMSAGEDGAWAVNDANELFVAKPGKGWWLRTDRMFRDFELMLDFWLPAGGEGVNSGVGLRGSSDGDPAFTGMEIQILDTHGQTPDVHNCGAVYEAIAPSAMAVKPAGQWNSYRIRLVGDTLDVWLNGQQIHKGAKIDGRGYFRSPEHALPLNARATTGYISLQDHGHAVRFRNIKLRDLSVDPEPEGMTPVVLTDELMRKGGGSWEDGGGGGRTIIGKDGPGHLFTEEMPGDIEIRALVKVSVKGNSGLYFRVEPNKDDPDSWPSGYEAQVDNHDPVNFTGCIYGRAHPAEGTKCITKDEAWFDYRIRAEGEHIRTWINGIPVVDARLDGFDQGRIALQTHNPGSVIEYRDLRWIEIEPE